MSIDISEPFSSYDLIATLTAAIMTWVDAQRDIWIPPNWAVRCQIYGLVGILSLVNGFITYIIYPIFAQTTGIPLGLEALLIGAGYFLLLRIIAVKLKFGENETPELSFSSLIYEPLQALLFRRIDEIIDPYLEAEIEKLSAKLTLEELTFRVYNRINRVNSKLLAPEKKEEVKQWLSDTLANNTQEQIKKNILAQVLVTKRFQV
ncbi:hypothetical protein H1P_2960009 [Hyella patelloides LEGE 07179]|uniref:Uncharacterized protein n=1 Tax=Hyella patelloides LEGE 07179 TaxID=945734 RepID=A0A563VUF6_9CYAN|nr:hypothetical protein [Hyella patelloides]VEP14884.1 hypothetical protein H1P_2950003 [Hyella patelloides LEGE 07179]VEP14901.1 hypothetical protein H1P_2960009 [Hyella patelloides LEGE 07179]